MSIMCKICVLVWCSFLTVAVLGQQTKPLTLTGRVVDSKARPVIGAEVAAYEQFYDYSAGEDYAKLLDRIRKSDANGHFILNANICNQNNVFVIARKKGLALGWDCLNYYTGNKARGNFNIVLEAPSILSGTVVNEAGNPIAKAKVRALPKTSYLYELRQRPILAPKQWLITQTDAKGNFSFNNFAPDVSADFWVNAPGWTSVYKYTTNYQSSCGFEAGRTDIRLVLPAEVPIRGRVIDAESGSPVTGAHVIIKPDDIKEHENPYCANRTVSGQDGHFHFKGVPAGKHYVKVSISQETMELVDKRVKVDVQADHALKEVLVELDKGGLIEIIALEATTRNPISDIAFDFLQAKQDEKSNFYKRSETGSNGRLTVCAPPGKCNFSASCVGYSPRSVQDQAVGCSLYPPESVRGQVTVIKGQTSRLEILLNRNPSVSGTVIDESGKAVPAVLVEAHPDGDIALTGADGSFEVGFRPGTPYQSLVARHIERNLAAMVDVTDHSKPIQITLKPALSIAGQVTDPEGNGIPAARLSLWVYRNKYLSLFSSDAFTDAQGRYQTRAILPEHTRFGYRISVDVSGYGPKKYKRVSITGVPGAPVEMKTLVLQPANQMVSGVVVDANGNPVAGVPVFTHRRPNVDQPFRTTATDERGMFVVHRLCKGQLKLQANFDGPGFTTAKGGDQNIKIVLGQSRIHTR